MVPTNEPPEQEAIRRIGLANDRFQLRFARLLRAQGLTPSQYHVLRILRDAGEPTPILDVAGRMATAVPGITGLMDRLEAMGLARRERSTEDRRVVFAAITGRGVDLLAGLDEPVRDLHARLIGPLSPVELRQLIRLLEKVGEAMAGDNG